MAKTDYEHQRQEIVRKIRSGETTSADGLRQLGFLARLEACERQERAEKRESGK